MALLLSYSRSPRSRVPAGYLVVRAGGAGHGSRLRPLGVPGPTLGVLIVDKRSICSADLHWLQFFDLGFYPSDTSPILQLLIAFLACSNCTCLQHFEYLGWRVALLTCFQVAPRVQFASMYPLSGCCIFDWEAGIIQGSDYYGEWCDVVPGLREPFGNAVGEVVFTVAFFAAACGCCFLAFDDALATGDDVRGLVHEQCPALP